MNKPNFYNCSSLYEDINPDNIHIRDCNFMKKYRVIEAFKGGGGAMIYKIDSSNGFKVLKIIPGIKDSLVEVVIGCQLGMLVNNNISNAYLVPEKWVKCDYFYDNFGKMDDMFEHLLNGSYYYMVLPLADDTLATIGNNISDYDLVCMIFELLYGLVAARFFFLGFFHKDIKAANIFINKNNNNNDVSRIYKIKNKDFVLNSKYVAMLGDFGESYATFVNDDLSMKRSLPNDGKGDLDMLINSFIITYPKSNLLNDLYGLKISLINDKGYKDYDTIIDVLTENPIFNRLKLTQPYDNDNNINFKSWENAIA